MVNVGIPLNAGEMTISMKSSNKSIDDILLDNNFGIKEGFWLFDVLPQKHPFILDEESRKVFH